MANVDNPFGLRPIRRGGASYMSGGGNVYAVPVATIPLAPGDVVVVDGDGDGNGIPTIAPATVDGSATGVMLGVTNSPSPGLDGTGTVTFDTTLNTITSASVIQYILVEDDPQVTYAAQASTALTDADLSGNAALVITAAVQDGKSLMEIGASDPADATAPLKVLRLQQLVNNEVGQFGIYEVLINASTQANNIAGVD